MPWTSPPQLAIAAGVEALRDAGIPLVMGYRQTSKGTYLPNRWMLPEALADETGVVFASAFPGLQRMSDEADRFYEYKNLAARSKNCAACWPLVPASQSELLATLTERIASMEARLAEIDYHFDRRFIFRVPGDGPFAVCEYMGRAAQIRMSTPPVPLQRSAVAHWRGLDPAPGAPAG